MKKVFLALVLVACGGNSTENAAPASPSSPSSSSGPSSTSAPATAGGEGAECGDDVAIQKKCAAGLVCSPKPNAPVSEHTPGVCKKP